MDKAKKNTVIHAAADRMAANYKSSQIPMYGDALRMPNRNAVIEIIRVATTISSTYAVNIIFPILYAGVFYLAFIGILTLLFGWLEKKLNYFRV